jgi:hypothetical protein
MERGPILCQIGAKYENQVGSKKKHSVMERSSEACSGYIS